MSMTRDYGEIVFECDSDNCLEHIETGTEQWENAKQVFDRAGWRAVHMHGTWEHYCPTCRQIGVL